MNVLSYIWLFIVLWSFCTHCTTHILSRKRVRPLARTQGPPPSLAQEAEGEGREGYK